MQSLFPLAVERCYLTPEDIEDALNSGVRLAAVRVETLDWISRRSVEDPVDCAWVAWRGGGDLKRLERVYWVVKHQNQNNPGEWVRDKWTYSTRSLAFSMRWGSDRVFRVSVFKVKKNTLAGTK